MENTFTLPFRTSTETNDLETIEHLFADCYIIKEMWRNTEEWISNEFDRHINFDRKSILFGKFNKCDNLMILTIKHYIYN